MDASTEPAPRGVLDPRSGERWFELDMQRPGEELDLASLAVELGYFDQAHFARDFKAVVGSPPNRYARTIARAD